MSKFERNMIKVEVAQEIISSHVKTLGAETVDILSALGRVVARSIFSNCDIPAFNNSAMDGYAVKAKDIQGATHSKPRLLKVIEDLPAGYVASKRIKRLEAIRIMTGAPMPQGADSVVMVENTEKIKNQKSKIKITNQKLKIANQTTKKFIEVYKQVIIGENIRKAGEDVKRGELVIKRGSLIRPQEIGMLAALGIRKVSVMRKPKVGIISTGDELVDLGSSLKPGKIRDSNRYSLLAQVSKCGAIGMNFGISKDARGEIKNKLKSALKANPDMLLVSGGISVGDYDFVKDALLELGMKALFWKVAMRPGKPIAFGTIKDTVIFGLPGNTVSSMIAFEEFVRPAILKMSGRNKLFLPEVTAVMEESFKKKKGLRYFVRVKIENKNLQLFVRLTGPQGSGILKSMVLADGIMVLPEEVEVVKPLDRVRVQLLSAQEV
jgi:molybdopterin molybdotransferase